MVASKVVVAVAGDLERPEISRHVISNPLIFSGLRTLHKSGPIIASTLVILPSLPSYRICLETLRKPRIQLRQHG